ncbi:MAG: histidine kinase [Hyphomicrobiales bacterium]|nr:MAG: histidine kinase [Hyphomicrobiales bacterium]
MPSLFRFLTVVGIICGTIYGGLYALAVLLEPPQKEMSTPVPGIKVRR